MQSKHEITSAKWSDYDSFSAELQPLIIWLLLTGRKPVLFSRQADDEQAIGVGCLRLFAAGYHDWRLRRY
ncbi:MAG: hypothetical protein R3C53_09155 [Pirellulaceae bacterium]